MEIEAVERTDQLCPACSAGDPLEIAYGLPGYELFEHAAELGYALGGCVLSDESPKWQCRVCETQWGLVPW